MLLSRLCAACRWMPDTIFCFHFWLRFCRIFNRWSHILLHFQHHRLASNMSLTMNKIPQFGSMSVMKVSSARSNQWWFWTCSKVIAHANRLMDAACRPSCPVYQHPCFHTCLLSKHCREPRWKWLLKRGLDFMLFRPDTDIDSLDILLVMLLIEICIHWKRMKREQAQNTLPSLAKKFVAISKFRPLSVIFGFTF